MQRWNFYMLLCALAICGCGQIKSRIRNVVDTARDRVWPIFDEYKPDTRFNKKRFGEFLMVPLSPDVREIYGHDDRMGIDSKFQIAFRCNEKTVQAIVSAHKMSPDTSRWDCNERFSTRFAWWQPSEYCQASRWVYNDNNRYFQYLWYDSASQRAWYLDFDL